MVQDANTLLSDALGLKQGDTPFPWQEDVLSRFLKGEIPEALDIPTGLGKTAVMTIWLVARICGANLPRRLVYVVDRRAVVDQATDEALRLRSLVDSKRDLKEKLGLRDDQSLPISTLRGQYVDNREWLEDPAAPAIVVGTVDMVGSRLLFEGYGVSRKMRPYHAGLLGADALVVLDEAHLVPPFERLLRAIATDSAFRPSASQQDQLVPQFRLLALSATGCTRTYGVAGLTDKDLAHLVAGKRLNAKKSLRIEKLDENTKLEDKLAEEAWRLTGDGKKAVRVTVYSDSREGAQRAKDALEKRAKGDTKTGTPTVETELFVGARRVFEREQAKERLKELGFIAGTEVACTRPVFLFATSAGEVGVDLDADHMVCDLVAWERMVQRLGRVNRRGDGEASVVVIVEPKPNPSKKEQEALEKRERDGELDDKERERVEAYDKKVRQWESRWKLLTALRNNDDGSFEASPSALLDLKKRSEADAALRTLLDDATTPEPLRPALTRPLVDAWAMTSLERHTGRPEIEPWLRGWIEEEAPQTRVVWRKYLPVRAGGPAPRDKEIEAFFEAVPPHVSEMLETETFRVVEWITERAERVLKLPGRHDEVTNDFRLRGDDVVAFALAPDGGLRKAFTLAEIRSLGDKKKGFSGLLSGATLVLDARLGGLKDGLLDPEEGGLPRAADDGEAWLGEGAIGFRVRSIETSTALTRESNWRERFRFASEVTENGEVARWLVVEKWRTDAATEEDRAAANPQLLDEHECWTEKHARRLAKALVFNEEYENLLALAARLHDEGKRSRRWQRAFNAPADGTYAKTEGPINYQLLDGYRHELGSLLRVENDERVQKLSDEHRDLVLHLIAAHHGSARPVIGTSGCDDRPPSLLEDKAAEIALRFARLQGRWGPWGLAWWEALLRAADQQASRENDARAARGGGG